jgi:hypothetical protein
MRDRLQQIGARTIDLAQSDERLPKIVTAAASKPEHLEIL